MAYYGKPLIAVVLGWAGIAGLVLALGGEPFRSAWWAWVTVLYVHWVGITYLIWLAFDFRSVSFSTPAVRSVRVEEGLIIVGHKDWLGNAVAVLLYKREGDYERLLCPGYVFNVQGNGLVQIRLQTEELNESEVIALKGKISDGDFGSLIIKPGQNAGV